MTDSHMRRAFTALSRITPAAAAVTSIDDLLRLVTERAAKLVGVERCSIYMREERQNLFRGCVGCCANCSKTRCLIRVSPGLHHCSVPPACRSVASKRSLRSASSSVT